MKIISFILSWQFISLANFVRVGSSRQTVLELTISPNEDETITAHLQPTDQKLANEYLPIWTVHKDNPEIMQLEAHVIKEIGAFTMYQDPSTSAAAVFFHQRQQFDGIVDSRYVVEGLYWHFGAVYHKEPHTISVKRRDRSRFYTDILPTSEISVSIQLLEETSNMGADSEDAIEETRLRRQISDTFYVETLVFVNYDVFEGLDSGSNKYDSTVSYILTLLNNVDMLYSKVRDPIIKINIAGIIIGNSIESFPLYMGGECHEKIRNSAKQLEDSMDVRCISMFIRRFCQENMKTIPTGTYDITVVLTRYGLHHHEYNPKTGDRILRRVGGAAESPMDEYYELMKLGTMPVLVATVSDQKEYESFAILAHEIAHLFSVKHDVSSEAKHKLMQSTGKYSPMSLSWSRESKDRLKIFFASPDSCPFRNEPGSLRPHRPRRIMNADEQCKCYGYKSAKIDMFDRVRGRVGVRCDENIQCKHQNGTIIDGPILMDGTPCGWDKVCWATKCVSTKKRDSCFNLLSN